MPRSRGYRRSRKKGRVRRRRRRPGARSLVAKVAKNAYRISKLRMSQEIKHRDLVEVTGVDVTPNLSTYPVCNLVLGGQGPVLDNPGNPIANGEAYRSSAEVLLKYVQLRIVIQASKAMPAAADVWNTYRILVVRRKVKHNSDPPLWADLFMTGVPTSAYQRTNKEKLAKWQVMYDSGSRVLGKLGNTSPIRTHKIVLQNVRNHYTGDDNLPGSMKQGQLYVMAISDSGVAPHPTITIFNRFSFESV